MKDYTRSDQRARAHEMAPLGAMLAAGEAAAADERAARLAGLVRIERGPAAFRITFPRLSAAERGTPAARAAWDDSRRPMADVKAMAGRRFDSMQAAWIVPLDQAETVEALSIDYCTEIEAAATDPDAGARIAELEAAVATLTAERDAAVALADEYAGLLDRQAVAA